TLLFATVSFAEAAPVTNVVVLTVTVQLAARAARWSLTLVAPSSPLAVSEPALTDPRFTVEAGTLMVRAPPVMLNVAIVSPGAAWAAGASSPRPLAARATALAAAAIRSLGRMVVPTLP